MGGVSPQLQASPCPDCGGNCDPECGQHPKGCLYGGIVCNEWAVATGCELPHWNVARAVAKDFLRSLRLDVRVVRNP